MVLFNRNLDTTNSRMIGGPGCTVEMDESCFVRKRKHNRGGAAGVRVGRWVFGLIERRDGREIKPSPLALARVFVVDTRIADNLEPLIRR